MTAQSPTMPTSPPLGRAVVGSLVAHLALLTLALTWSSLVPVSKPLIDLDDVMPVAIVTRKSPDAMPHRAERTQPQPAAVEETPAPVPPPPPEPVPAAVIPPVTPATPPPPEPKTKPEPSFEEVMRSLGPAPQNDTPLGTTDRKQSDPDGSADADADGQDGIPIGDPEFNAYIARLSALFREEFAPLDYLKNNHYVTQIFIKVDESGRITEARIFKESGNPSWDRAALAAAQKVTQVELPPERFRARMKNGYAISFKD